MKIDDFAFFFYGNFDRTYQIRNVKMGFLVLVALIGDREDL